MKLKKGNRFCGQREATSGAETRVLMEWQIRSQFQGAESARTSRPHWAFISPSLKCGQTFLPCLLGTCLKGAGEASLLHKEKFRQRDRKGINQETVKNGTSQIQAIKGNTNIAMILQFDNLGKKTVIRIVTNNNVQKRRETSSSLS